MNTSPSVANDIQVAFNFALAHGDFPSGVGKSRFSYVDGDVCALR
jgi:hypothetical protein